MGRSDGKALSEIEYGYVGGGDGGLSRTSLMEFIRQKQFVYGDIQKA